MTADQDLSARLAEFAKSDCRDNEFAKWCQTAWQAYSTGQLITLADHESAVQAAVAKAVEASDKALQDALAYIDKGHPGMARSGWWIIPAVIGGGVIWWWLLT